MGKLNRASSREASVAAPRVRALDPLSQAPGQEKHQNDKKNDTQSTTGIVAPAPAVRPCGNCADQHEHQNNDQNGSKTHSRVLLCLRKCLKYGSAVAR